MDLKIVFVQWWLIDMTEAMQRDPGEEVSVVVNHSHFQGVVDCSPRWHPCTHSVGMTLRKSFEEVGFVKYSSRTSGCC